MKQLRPRLIKDLEPFVLDPKRTVEQERVDWHIAYYLEHGKFIGPLALEIGGPRCERLQLDAYLVDGNHRFQAAKALALETVEVTHIDCTTHPRQSTTTLL
jgi:hypothetical protein